MHTFLHALDRAPLVGAHRPAVTCGDTTISFGGMVERVALLAGALEGLGVGPGERVAVLAGNSAEYIELYVGVPAAARVVVPLNTRWAEPELIYALDDAGVAVLVTDRDPGSLADHVGTVVRLDGDGGRSEYHRLLEEATPAEVGDGVEEDTLAGLFYTGGTTGQSKGVMLTHRNLVANTFHQQQATPLHSDDVYLVVAPLFHAAGSTSVLQCLAQGTHQVVAPGTFDPALALDLVERYGATSTLVVPTMMAAILEVQAVEPRDVTSVRIIGHGGSPIAFELVASRHQGVPRRRARAPLRRHRDGPHPHRPPPRGAG